MVRKVTVYRVLSRQSSSSSSSSVKHDPLIPKDGGVERVQERVQDVQRLARVDEQLAHARQQVVDHLTRNAPPAFFALSARLTHDRRQHLQHFRVDEDAEEHADDVLALRVQLARLLLLVGAGAADDEEIVDDGLQCGDGVRCGVLTGSHQFVAKLDDARHRDDRFRMVFLVGQEDEKLEDVRD